MKCALLGFASEELTKILNRATHQNIPLSNFKMLIPVLSRHAVKQIKPFDTTKNIT